MKNMLLPAFLHNAENILKEKIDINSFRTIFLDETIILNKTMEPHLYHIDEKIILDLPFSKCYFEYVQDKRMRIDINDTHVEFDYIYVSEKSPGDYNIIVGFPEPIYINYIPKGSPLYVGFLKWLKFLLTEMRSSNYIMGNVAFSKYRIRRLNYKISIRNIVYIIHKKNKKKYSRGMNHQLVDWSHQWEVRGHWRKCRSIGKDRNGDYLISGYTWVKDFIKGDKDKDLIIKTRVFTSNNHEEVR